MYMVNKIVKGLIIGGTALSLEAAVATQELQAQNPDAPVNFQFYILPGSQNYSFLADRKTEKTDVYGRTFRTTTNDSISRYLKVVNGKILEVVEIYGEDRKDFGAGGSHSTIINDPRNGRYSLIDKFWNNTVRAVIVDGKEIPKDEYYAYFLGSAADTSVFYPGTVFDDVDTLTGPMLRALSSETYDELLYEIQSNKYNLSKQMLKNVKSGGARGFDSRQYRPGYGPGSTQGTSGGYKVSKGNNPSNNKPAYNGPSNNVPPSIKARGGTRGQ
jgi:hypothetical protein